jgi:hypothetical protein
MALDETTGRFERAFAAIDSANAEDPNSLVFEGRSWPKEQLHAERASHWLRVLEPEAGESLQLAVRAHHIRRWSLPRAEYPVGRAGYHAWRRELQRRHAEEAERLLLAAGYSQDEVDRVGSLIRKRGLGEDPEAQTFEDVLCLVFMETQLERFATAHESDKVVDILARTLPKMSAEATGVAAGLASTPRLKELLERAVARNAADSTRREPGAGNPSDE